MRNLISLAIKCNHFEGLVQVRSGHRDLGRPRRRDDQPRGVPRLRAGGPRLVPDKCLAHIIALQCILLRWICLCLP